MINLDIQQAWCRHWVRDRLDIQPSGSLVLLINDAKTDGIGLARKHRQAIGRLTTELRWHFSHPVFVLLSIVDGPLKDDSMSGIVDEQVNVDNSTDLCGWVGAANSLLLLSGQALSDQAVPLLDTLSKIATAFRKPCNRVFLEGPIDSISRLDWECLHQAPTAAKQSDPRKASIDFASAIRMLGESLNASKMGSETAEVTDREAGSRYGFRQAG
jgi:hypothetical protein